MVHHIAAHSEVEHQMIGEDIALQTTTNGEKEYKITCHNMSPNIPVEGIMIHNGMPENIKTNIIASHHLRNKPQYFVSDGRWVRWFGVGRRSETKSTKLTPNLVVNHPYRHKSD